MDPGVLALLIPIVAIVCGTVLKALSMRGEGRHSGLSAKQAERLEVLEHEVGLLRQELGETQERLDFTERLLAQDRGINRLGPEH